MAVKIPIVTVFDSKGLKQAQYQLKKVEGNVNNLKRNFAIAGAALAGAFVAIGKAVGDAAESQKVLAQTEAVLKSTGTTANGTAKDIQAMAQSLQKSTAFNDEAILSGANLLLTFKNIQNQAGAGNDIFNQTTQAMLDVARAMGTDASTEAIRLGKALNDPVKGISALTRVGIQFTDQQKEQIKALAESGDLMGAQKIILAELQSQFGGSAAAYADTFAGQMESLNNELNDLSEEIGFMVMPAIQELVSEFRDLIPVIGPQIKAAIESVDWKGLVTTLVDLVTWFVENARVIGIVVGAVFALNTAYNLGRVAIGLYNGVAMVLNGTLLAQKGAMEATIGSAGRLATALKLIGVAAAVYRVTTEYIRLKDAVEKAAPAADQFSKNVYATSGAVSTLSPIQTVFFKIANAILVATGNANTYKNTTPAINKIGFSSHTTNINAIENAWKKAQDAKNRYGNSGAMWGGADSGITTPPSGRGVPEIEIPTLTGGGGGNNKKQSISEILKKEAKLAKKESALLGKGLSQGLVDKVLGSTTPLKEANKILQKIGNTAGKFAEKLQKQFNKTKAGQQELAAIAAENEKAIAELTEALEESGGSDSEALDEKEQAYKDFLNNIKQTFENIKSTILGAFELKTLGGSTDSIIRNMKKLLTTTRQFSSNVMQLSAMGLSPELLAQVIQAGPLAGSRLAAALVAGGSQAIAQISEGFAEFQGLASGIATTGISSQYGATTVQNTYNINVDGGLGSGATIGKAVVDAIRSYERGSGRVFQRAIT
jgi:hypothetical protein